MAADTSPSPGTRDVDAIAVDVAIRLVLLGLFVYWSLIVVAPFLTLVIWAIILAVSLYPVHQWLAVRLGGRSRLASVLITVLGLIIVLGPAATLAVSLVESIQAFLAALRDGSFGLPPPSERVRTWPFIGQNLYELWSLAATNLQAVLETYRPFLLSTGGTVLGKVAKVAGGVLTIAASVVIAGFLYSHGPILARGAQKLAKRLVVDRGEAFVSLAGATIRNVARGVVGVSMLQALLAGAGLLVAQIPGAGLIAFGVLILSIVQIGPGLLLIPTVIWVWTSMDAITALLFTLYMIPVTFIDNVLKPIVMARGLRTPTLVIFVGLLGGTLTHGLIGLFLGPIVLAVFYELLTAWVTVVEPRATPLPPEGDCPPRGTDPEPE